MEKKEIYQQIGFFLEEWDPIGILQHFEHISNIDGAVGEYDHYIEPIIEAYLSDKLLDELLVKIYSDLRDDPSNEEKKRIEILAKNISTFLDLHDLKKNFRDD